ncbi:hypothetical protein [Halobacillus litoralis]|nr:hypothetical protein [Halobacillus litoralis]
MERFNQWVHLEDLVNHGIYYVVFLGGIEREITKLLGTAAE